jgi:hypothetical protein
MSVPGEVLAGQRVAFGREHSVGEHGGAGVDMWERLVGRAHLKKRRERFPAIADSVRQ